MALHLTIYRLAPDAWAETMQQGTEALGRFAWDEAGNARPGIVFDSIYSFWDGYWFMLDPAGRTAAPEGWETTQTPSPLAAAVVGTRIAPVPRDGEDFRLRSNTPDDVREAARALDRAPELRAVDPVALEAVNLYHGRHCPGVPTGRSLATFQPVYEALRAFYRDAAASGQGTVHEIG